MKRYTYRITEVLTRDVTVLATDENVAQEQVQDLYDTEEVSLDYDDLSQHFIDLVETEEE